MAQDTVEAKRRAYLSADTEANLFITQSLRCKPQSKTFNRWFDKKYAELRAERARTKAGYDAVKPAEAPRKQRLIETAQGHPDNASVQAARRICNKNGWQWDDTQAPQMALFA